MAAANRAVLSTLLDTVLNDELVTEIIDKAVRTLTSDDAPERRRRLESERAGLTREIDRLTDALAAGGNLPSLLEALQQRERARRAITQATWRS